MWYPYRLADCGSSPDLTRLATKSPVWNNDEEEEDEEEDESDDRLSQMSSSTFNTSSYVSGPCTGNCYPGATQGYPPMMYPAHGYHSPSQPQAPTMYPGMIGLQKSMTCSFIPNYGYGYPYTQYQQQQPPLLIEEPEKGSPQEHGTQNFLQMDPQDYSPDTDQKDASPQPLKTVDDTTAAVKKKYSDASLKPDSSLPPVIRRRNRNRRKMLAQSMVDGGCWDVTGRYRSQSVSDEQWSQLLAAQGHAPPPPPPSAEPSTNQRNRFNTVGGGVANNRGGPGRGMMSSASVCDLNTLAQQQQQQQQPQHLHQQQHMQPQQHQLMPHMGGMHQSGSFQQLNMVPYTGGMMWAPPPCDMCHAPPPMYPPPLPSHGMKRAASNISMNMSSASSDVTGYPWQPHMHHHMAPPMYPGYYPPPPPHMMPNSMQGSSISIPDSMAAFSKVSSSPAPSVRSSSRRSHKSNKSRSFSTADLSRRTRSSHRSESDDSTTSSPSVEEEIHNSSAKPGYPGGPLAWQCDHCTFINQAGTRMCGMCSKTPGAGSHQRATRRVSDRRRSEQRRFVQRRNNDNEDDDREPSDYENDGKQNNTQYNNNRDNRRDKSSKSSTTSRNKKKLRRRGGSSGSASDVVEELERQLSDMKVSKSRGPEYEGISSRLKERERDKDRERGSRKREGKTQRRD